MDRALSLAGSVPPSPDILGTILGVDTSVDLRTGSTYRLIVLDGWMRPIKDRALNPLVSLFARQMSPFAVTWLAFVAGIGAALLAYSGSLLWAVGLWLLGRILDGLDGAIARATGSQSDYGGYLDIFLDLVVYTCVPLAVAFRAMTPFALGAAALLLGTFYVNLGAWMYLSALLEKRRAAGDNPTSVVMPKGLVEGTETILFYTAFLLLPAWAPVLFLVMAVLTLLSAIQRVIAARRALHRGTQR